LLSHLKMKHKKTNIKNGDIFGIVINQKVSFFSKLRKNSLMCLIVMDTLM
jgi:hypothetical protein